MGYAISALKTCFTFINILSMMSAAVFIGFGVFMLIGRQDAIGLGLHEISVALLATGAGTAVLSMIGFCSGVGRRSYMMYFYSGCLLLGSVYFVGFGVLIAFRRGKTEEYMDNSWNEMSSPLKDAFESVHNCCGFRSPVDRTNCSEFKQNTLTACSGQMIQRQAELLKWLCVVMFIVAVLIFINYLVAYWLVRQYAKSRRNFEQTRAEAKERVESGKKLTKASKSSEPDLIGSSMKSVKINGNDGPGSLKYLPDFLKPTPKPKIISGSNFPRSTGSMLTYDQIAAKYRTEKE